MLLSHLLANLPGMEGPWELAGDGQVLGVAYDSRQVAPGFIFVAIKGFQTDGHLYVPEAVRRGAMAVVLQDKVEVPRGVLAFMARDTREILPRLAARFYHHPAQKMKVVGVTGTNGKTTTTNLIDAIFREQGLVTGLMGTIHNRIGPRVLAVEHTTPESSDLQRLLAEMVEEGVQAVTMEVSSHALALHRVDACEFDLAVFTNLTQDHLDFHGDMESYLKAKGLLFQSLGQGAQKPGSKWAVINIDDPAARTMIKLCRVPVLTYGLDRPAHVTARQVQVTAKGVSFTMDYGSGSIDLQLQLTGRFNVYNALAAAATGLAAGIDPAVIKKALEGVAGVAGRFELVDRGQDFAVIVDYAHTPDGLENVLRTARAITTGRLITVFGCGGDRDRTKRPLMGELAARLSDVAVVTSDNPRTEEPRAIIRDIMVGVQRVTGVHHLVEPDRRQAIRRAIQMATTGDVVLIAGKGHEDYQIVGTERHHFDDREEAAYWLEQR